MFLVTKLEKTRALVNELSPEELTQLLQWLQAELESYPLHIIRTPGVCGGRARVFRTRIPVWLLVGYRKAGWSEAKILDNYPQLSVMDLQHAWTYYDTHREEIDRDLAEQEEE
jgi:uncharacterized protein (DUF433 family)